MAGERDRFEWTVLVVVWVLPLLALAGLLVWMDLLWLAFALLVVEAVAAVLVLLATRSSPETPDRSAAPTRPWLVPVVMVGVMVGLLAVTLVAVSLGE